jgi:hypothetical protein
MIANSVFVASIVWLAVAMYLLSELSFLAPYRDLILHRYGWQLLSFGGVLFVNIAAITYMINRKIFLKDTGRKLAHIEKQLRTGSSISAELTDRLSE